MRCDGVLLLSALVFAGCPSPRSSEGLKTTPVAQLYDHDTFVCDAMPTLVRHCSYSACHGRENHAFRVYAPGKLRLGNVASRADRDAALTSDEIEANYASATGMLLPARPSQGTSLDLQTAPLLRKALKAEFGGGEHHGIGIFPFPPARTLDDDLEWQGLVKWVAGEKLESPPSSDCAALMATLSGSGS